ncbi:hypothetical protein AMJ44_12245 [candidate division WOR-1 bacterium DG_54_3]|uniref:Uncharacterized protein n=1 Tax=candidate division WOR-1 bacterium DG_54_3 TaxID=1703775 RepID=A0A0S7XQG5_UNCSA|nr:MAG: hypothetical protein AMJ44_12245 [candidate division WOR-1 bacterium DG_54_3]
MAQEYAFSNYIFAISPHKGWQDKPSVSLDHDWYFVGMSPELPTPKYSRIEYDRARSYIEPHFHDTEITQRGVPQEFELPEFDCPKEMLNYWLMAFFQNVTDGGTDPFSHLFSVPTVLPDFTADAGYMLHFAAKHPTSAKSWLLGNCIVTALGIRITHDEAVGNRLTVKPTLLSRLPEPLTAPVSWTLQTPAESYWLTNVLTGEDDDSYFQVVPDTPELVSLEFNLTNGGYGRGQDSSGRPRQFRCEQFRGEGNLRLIKDATSDAYYADIVGTNVARLWAYWQTTIASITAGDLSIDLNGAQWAEGAAVEEGEVTEQINNFPFKLSRTVAHSMAKITTVDTTATIDSLFT